jgi:hypothetical protein
MRLFALVFALLTLLLVGCVFNTQGLPSAALPGEQGVDVTTDGGAHDRGAYDLSVPAERVATDRGKTDRGPRDHRPPDQIPLDNAVPSDQQPLPDKGAIIPITAAALGSAFSGTKVQCVKASGQAQTSTIPVADSSIVVFFNGNVTLAGAGTPTKTWIGGKPSVIVVFNPNACDLEDPAGYSEWTSGGLLIRGAALDGQGRLVLQFGVTVKDINLLNVNSDGTFQVDYFGPDDALLSTWPQLVKPVNKAKALILQLGNA